jgi:hypothetical protein
MSQITIRKLANVCGVSIEEMKSELIVCFLASNAEVREKLNEMGIKIDDDGTGI